MSRTDERIREDLRTLARPVDLGGVLERVERRKTRRRIRRRAGQAALTVVVLGVSLTATVLATRSLGSHDVTVPGGGHSSGGRGAAQRFNAICDDSEMQADVDGDGAVDQVDVFSASSGDSCADSPDVGHHYFLSISGGKYTNESPLGQPTPYPETRFYGVDQALPECDQPFACRLFSASDLSGDGVREIAVQTGSDGGFDSLTFYRAEVTPATPPVEHAALIRLDVAAPGDPWNNRYGIDPGPVTLWWGASPDAVRWVSCADRNGERVVVVSTGVPSNGEGWDLHQTFLRLDGDTLSVVDTSDETRAEAPTIPGDFCGAPIWQPGNG